MLEEIMVKTILGEESGTGENVEKQYRYFERAFKELKDMLDDIDFDSGNSIKKISKPEMANLFLEEDGTTVVKFVSDIVLTDSDAIPKVMEAAKHYSLGERYSKYLQVRFARSGLDLQLKITVRIPPELVAKISKGATNWLKKGKTIEKTVTKLISVIGK